MSICKKLKDLINKMESKPANGLQKRWFIKGLHLKLQKKMKIVSPSSYTEAYNQAMNLESEQKTKKKSSSSDSDDDATLEKESSDDEKGSKKVRALQKDMIRMMKEFKNMQKETKGNDLWCTECKTKGHTKGSCPKNQFCEICQIMGHSTKECPLQYENKRTSTNAPDLGGLHVRRERKHQ